MGISGIWTLRFEPVPPMREVQGWLIEARTRPILPYGMPRLGEVYLFGLSSWSQLSPSPMPSRNNHIHVHLPISSVCVCRDTISAFPFHPSGCPPKQPGDASLGASQGFNALTMTCLSLSSPSRRPATRQSNLPLHPSPSSVPFSAPCLALHLFHPSLIPSIHSPSSVDRHVFGPGDPASPANSLSSGRTQARGGENAHLLLGEMPLGDAVDGGAPTREPLLSDLHRSRDAIYCQLRL